ncbi:hypothetical protein PBCVCVR1_185L [Paramecium bursaria Chlorella virus CVR-1]|uniref:Uncharacterized protein n=1 Tax=Paramecium bursaria Chlorella virus CVA-1 TaxID=42683 RepID=M1HVI1_9PHYC|nr:hypothetical protein F8205_gp060 [Paramecium bursaria Chlorella virus CVA-1]AGE50415.1 hypothetical protein PBCVCVA1_178L [Paramecium bursaria Chlorella virus CVA-1]AGE52092.1 hypothetical protein PBCVCVR1_185L [Paramecium bursaria Chlorella virus CVR-1]
MPTSKRKSLTVNMNTPVKSHPIDIMVPNAPKKPFAPLTLYRSDSYDVKDFLASVSNYHPADATITSGDGDTEDTANSSIEKSSFYSMVIKSITKCFRA